MKTPAASREQTTSRSPVVDFDTVMLLAYGGPRSVQEIRPFLQRVLEGIEVPEARMQALVERYLSIGGFSPINELTSGQARALQAELKERGVTLPVTFAMRHAPPFIGDVVYELSRRGVKTIRCIVMAPFRSEASYQRYQKQVDDALEALGSRAPLVSYASSFHTAPGFIAAVADNVKTAFSSIQPRARERATLVFTAHSIPLAMAKTSTYAQELQRSAGLVASALARERFRVCFQSRSGPARLPWLGPEIVEVIEQEALQGTSHLVVAPIGFVCDHLEVLYDLDIEAKEVALQRGMDFFRVATVNRHPRFIQALADIVTSE
ncbi:MAG: ferrochelatase [Deltaproteobacteria bacterium]|nr:ferrochelatase [Deltaproteobacteria bacterium]